MRYQGYPEYADEAKDFLGDLPKGWKSIRLRFLASEPLMYGANEAAISEDRNSPRFIRITDVNSDGTLSDETFKSIDYLITNEIQPT